MPSGTKPPTSQYLSQCIASQGHNELMLLALQSHPSWFGFNPHHQINKNSAGQYANHSILSLVQKSRFSNHHNLFFKSSAHLTYDIWLTIQRHQFVLSSRILRKSYLQNFAPAVAAILLRGVREIVYESHSQISPDSENWFTMNRNDVQTISLSEMDPVS